MANAVPAVASSSVSVNTAVIAVEDTSSNTVKVTLFGDVSIVSRTCYFDQAFAIASFPFYLNNDQAACLFQAGRRFSAEQQARIYLDRAEHSFHQLILKLQKKGFSDNEYRPALQYLTECGILDDSRFAAAWLYTRSLSKKEGYQRLFAELRKRGVSASVAKSALAVFFSEYSERGICAKAAERLLHKGFSRQKLYRALQRKGFSYPLIRECLIGLSKNFSLEDSKA